MVTCFERLVKGLVVWSRFAAVGDAVGALSANRWRLAPDSCCRRGPCGGWNQQLTGRTLDKEQAWKQAYFVSGPRALIKHGRLFPLHTHHTHHTPHHVTAASSPFQPSTWPPTSRAPSTAARVCLCVHFSHTSSLLLHADPSTKAGVPHVDPNRQLAHKQPRWLVAKKEGVEPFK